MQAHEFLVLGNVDLARNATLRIEPARDRVIYVWRGRVWVTQDGDPRDRVLDAGEWIRLERDGLAVVQAFLPSTLSVTELARPAPQGGFRRFWNRLMERPSRRPLGVL